MQTHRHTIAQKNDSVQTGVYGLTNVFGEYNGMTQDAVNARIASVTRGKRKGVKYIIKVL